MIKGNILVICYLDGRYPATVLTVRFWPICAADTRSVRAIQSHIVTVPPASEIRGSVFAPVLNPLGTKDKQAAAAQYTALAGPARFHEF
jgi:hypothetical protein